MLRTAARRAAERRALVLRTALPERGAFVVRAVLRLVVIFAICFRRVEPASEGNNGTGVHDRILLYGRPFSSPSGHFF